MKANELKNLGIRGAALRVAQEAGLEESVRPLVDVRLADLDQLSTEQQSQ